MRSSFIIALKKIKKRKLQNLLIGIIIASSAALLSTGIGIMLSMNKPIDNMFAEAKSSHDIVVFNEKNYDKSKIQDWWESRPEVEKTQLYNQLILGPDIKINGTKLTNQINFLSEVPDNKGDIDNFKIVEGNKTKSPGSGEVWINTGFANLNKAKIGDSLSINGRNYKISGIIVDTQFSSLMMGTERFFVKAGELENYPEYKANPGYALSIRYKNPSSSDSVWQRFQKYLNAPLIGMSIKYHGIYACYATILKYTGVFMVFFSLIIIVTVICIIRFIISNSIYNDYKSIGIYKALGFTSKGISLIYLIQYSILSIISTILGIALSKFTIDKMISSNLKVTGMEKVTMSYAIPFITSFILIISIVFITSLIGTLKTKNIKPVEAIREDIKTNNIPGKSIFASKLFNIFSPSAAIGIKGLINNKKSAAVIFITILITLYSGLSGVNLIHTTDLIGRNLGYWGFDNSMIDIKQTTKDKTFINKIENDVKNDKRVKGYTTFNFYMDASFVDKNGEIEKFDTIQVIGNSPELFGFMDMEGRDPKKTDEVSVSVNTAKDNNIHVGDYMEVYVNNKKLNLLVVGIYQSLNNLGRGIRLYEKTVKDADPGYEHMILLDLKDKNNINSYINNMKAKYGDKIEINDRQSEFGKEISMMNEGSLVSVMMIIIIMLSICFLNIFNIILMNINEERKSYGIYKAIGMTSGQIRNSILIRISLIFTTSLIIAVPLTLKATPALMSLIFINVGIAKYPVSISVSYMIMIAVICFVFSILSGYAASKMITRIKLRSLIED